MIKTKRLSIQPFQEADCTGMVNLLCNEEIKKTFMIPDFATKSMAERLFHQFKEWSYEEARYERGIYLGDQLIGFVNTVDAEGKYCKLPRYGKVRYETDTENSRGGLSRPSAYMCLLPYS